MEQNDLLVRLQQQFPKLSKGQKQIASYILNNYDRAAFITASKMGRMVGVSESTVVRFAYVVGYDGYPALQRALQELIRTRLTSMQRIQLTSDIAPNDVLRSVLKADMNNLRATIDTVDNVAFNGAMEALLKAKRVYIVGMRSATPLAEFLAYYLGYVREAVLPVTATISDAFEQMIHIDQDDVCLGISFPRYSSRTVEAMHFASSRGATTVAITDSPASPLAPLATYCLTAHSDMASFADSLVAPLSLINAIIVAAGMSRKDDLMNNFSQLEQLWGQHNVYVTRHSEDKPQ